MLSRVLCKGQGKQSGTRIQRFNFYLGSMLVYFFLNMFFQASKANIAEHHDRSSLQTCGLCFFIGPKGPKQRYTYFHPANTDLRGPFLIFIPKKTVVWIFPKTCRFGPFFGKPRPPQGLSWLKNLFGADRRLTPLGRQQAEELGKELRPDANGFGCFFCGVCGWFLGFVFILGWVWLYYSFFFCGVVWV